ncbi:hypothetical protein ACFYPK_32245 [Streptomyces halstedii]|uniref:hypothetical protein n=1 Tax=Streptomyces TaxID=1883 RepID=UPI0004A95EC3|nr:hypothetical protein [Streptomyces sp. NTK 937]KDQ70865.1 hypothetical protein DT87_27765 [Streptomyces sp. NTK 937]WSX40198.1 hypothetical protein OG291_03210 [Streptomyces halstedii]
MAKRCEDFVATTADMPGIASDAYIVRGLLALAQGDWGEAASWLSQGLPLLGRSSIHRLWAFWAGLLAVPSRGADLRPRRPGLTVT